MSRRGRRRIAMNEPLSAADPILDPASFLRRVHPFDVLPERSFSLAAHALQIAYFERGKAILTTGGEPSRFLYVVRKGSVRLERQGEVVLTLEEGDAFGYPSLLSGAVNFDAIADEDVLAYMVPEDRFRQLLREGGAFAAFFTTALARRLERARRADTHPAVDFHRTIEGLIQRPPLHVRSDATVREAAEKMSAAGISSVLVEGSEWGIMTDRDLRSRVLARGLGPETLVARAASYPLFRVSADTPVYDAWLAILERGFHHLAVEREGKILGVITGTDLLRYQTHGPLLAFKRIARLPDRSALPGYGEDLTRLVEVLQASGLEATRIARLVSGLNDTLVRRILGWAEDDLGPPPQKYAWIVFGSEGRYEQTLLTDQDNALVWQEESAPARAYFERLAGKAVGDLMAAGFPECAGGFMATSWNGPLEEWRERFATWITAPRAEAILHASIFFDFRVVSGALDLAPIQETIRTASAHVPFLAHLARGALAFRPPLTLFRQLKEEEGGFELKKGGLMPIVGLARAYALEAGAGGTRTVTRLEAAASTGLINREDSDTLIEAYRYLMQLRLREQLRRIRAGDRPDHRVPLASLSAVDRRHLKEVFSAIREAQSAAEWHFHTSEL